MRSNNCHYLDETQRHSIINFTFMDVAGLFSPASYKIAIAKIFLEAWNHDQEQWFVFRLSDSSFEHGMNLSVLGQQNHFS